VTAKYQSIDETLISQTHVFVTTNFVGFCLEFGKGHVGFALSCKVYMKYFIYELRL